MSKLPQALVYGGLLAGAGVATYFTWRQFFWRTEGEPGAVAQSSAVTGETRTGQGYVNGKPVTVQLASVGNGRFARSDAASAFKAMKDAASASGIDLQVISAFRTNEEQAELYNGWVAKKPGYNLAAKPGFSNHQAGLSFDLNTVSKGSDAYLWLKANAARFGFKNDVPSEHWHWTFDGAASFAGVGLAGPSNVSVYDFPKNGDVAKRPGTGSPVSALSAAPDVGSGASWALALGLGAVVVYQVFVRPDEGPRTLRRGAVTNPTVPQSAYQ